MTPPGTTVPGNDWTAVTAGPVDPVGVSVVVCHYEQHDQLARTLAQLSRQTHPAHLLEVVVVDDGSATAPVVPDGVRLVRRDDEGFTVAAARNAGARAARQPVLVFLDADTTPEPTFVAEMARLPGRLAEAVVVGRRRHADLTGVGAHEPVEEVGPARELPEPAWLRDGYARTADLRWADETSFRYVISAVLACHRWFFERTGGFDESFVRYGGEDWEWASRAWQQGAVLAHEPRAVAWHDGPDVTGRRAPVDKLGESLALARRVGVAPAAFAGLRVGPPELVASLDRTVPLEHRIVGADVLLQAFPTGRILVDQDVLDVLPGDDRLVLAPDGDPAGLDPDEPALGDAAIHLHLHASLLGPPAAWRDLVARLRGPDQAGTLVVADASGPLVTARSLRAHRRMWRWGRDDLFATWTGGPGVNGISRLPASYTVERHVGGW